MPFVSKLVFQEQRSSCRWLLVDGHRPSRLGPARSSHLTRKGRTTENTVCAVSERFSVRNERPASLRDVPAGSPALPRPERQLLEATSLDSRCKLCCLTFGAHKSSGRDAAAAGEALRSQRWGKKRLLLFFTFQFVLILPRIDCGCT